jgi:MEMO1 family protein
MTLRPPAVAGLFYEARPDALERDVRGYLQGPGAPLPAMAAVVPHAGYVYSGPVAGRVYGSIAVPREVVILCPNHTGQGAAAAINTAGAWRTPLGDAPVDSDLAARIANLAPSLEEDAVAHAREHSLEVQLPFLQIVRPDFRFVPVCLGEPSLDLCREVGLAAATAVRETEPRPLLIASSDLNHYESQAITERKDARALARIEEVDPEGLFGTVFGEDISMCGVLPVTALLFACRELGARSARVVARRTSGDETGDYSSVVGYAGVIVDQTIGAAGP